MKPLKDYVGILPYIARELMLAPPDLAIWPGPARVTPGVGIDRNQRNNPMQSKLLPGLRSDALSIGTYLQVLSLRAISLKSLGAVLWLLPCSVRV
jgi:hypothetical protein